MVSASHAGELQRIHDLIQQKLPPYEIFLDEVGRFVIEIIVAGRLVQVSCDEREITTLIARLCVAVKQRRAIDDENDRKLNQR